MTKNATDVSVAWTPDDGSISFARGRGDNRDMRLLDLASGSIDQLTDNNVEDHDMVFTPDGSAAIWVRGSDDARELMRLTLASGDVDRLTNDDFDDVDPAVSPDGRTLAFVSKRESGDRYELFFMDIDSLEIDRVLGIDGEDVHDPWWSPGGRFLVLSVGVEDNRDIRIFDTQTEDVLDITDNASNDLAPTWR